MPSASVSYQVQRSNFTEAPFTDSAPGRRLLVTITDIPGAGDLGGFVYKLVPGRNAAVFSHVATPADIEDWNLDTPDTDEIWFRSATLDLVVRSDTEIDEILENLAQDFRLLANGLDSINSLTAGEDLVEPSDLTATAPEGETVGNDDPTLRVNFPVALDAAPVGRLLVGITPSIAMKITNIDAAGFDIASSVNITAGHSVKWKVLLG